VAIVNMGCLYYVDRKGDVFKPLSSGDSLDFPVITGFAEEELVKDPAGNREALQKGIALIAVLKTAQSFRLEDVSEVHFDKGFGFTIFTSNGGVPVKLGNEGYSEKLERLARIYRDIQPQMLTLEYIDLNYLDKIIVKKALG
jgi:cell division protein FtsQ